VSRAYITGDRQAMLAPIPVAELLPPDHDAFAYQAMADELDLSAFYTAYRADGQGRPPYDPKVMLTLLWYCRSKGFVSARQVATACRDDLGARLITGNRYPDRATIDRFLSVHGQAVTALFAQTLRIGYEEGLVDVSVVAGDGSYLQANAAMGATVDQTQLLAQIDQLEQQLAAAQQAWADRAAAQPVGAQRDAGQPPGLADPGQEGLFDLPEPDTDPGQRPGRRGDRHRAAWRKVCTLTNLLRSRTQALSELRSRPDRERADWQERLDKQQQRVDRAAQRLEQVRGQVADRNARRAAAEATGPKTGGRRPVPADEHNKVARVRNQLQTATQRLQGIAANPPAGGRINTTDPASAIMPAKHGGFDQLHNIQALAAKRQFVIAIGTHPSSNDKQALTNLLDTGRANLDAAGITDPIGAALFDAGYASEANFTAETPCQLLLVAVEKEARQTGRQQDDTSTAPTAWQLMAQRLDQPDNHQLYKQRAAIIEPLFAQLFTRFGRGTHARGDQVEVELHLWATTHNLGKIIRHRRRHLPTHTRTG
jgi:transposase